MPQGQCRHEVMIGLTALTYLCVKVEGHDGPHQIAISSDFDLIDAKHDLGGFNAAPKVSESESTTADREPAAAAP